jgi:hypothetical protein
MSVLDESTCLPKTSSGASILDKMSGDVPCRLRAASRQYRYSAPPALGMRKRYLLLPFQSHARVLQIHVFIDRVIDPRDLPDRIIERRPK